MAPPACTTAGTSAEEPSLGPGSPPGVAVQPHGLSHTRAPFRGEGPGPWPRAPFHSAGPPGSSAGFSHSNPLHGAGRDLILPCPSLPHTCVLGSAKQEQPNGPEDSSACSASEAVLAPRASPPAAPIRPAPCFWLSGSHRLLLRPKLKGAQAVSPQLLTVDSPPSLGKAQQDAERMYL